MSTPKAEALKNAGWRLVVDDQQLHDELCLRRGFSLQKPNRIDIPQGSLIYDFEYMRGRVGLDPEVETCLREIAIEHFVTNFVDQRCILINVNHDSYDFVPGQLMLDATFEPWPCDLVPGFQYVSISDPLFTTGLYSNWGPRLRLIAYGDQLVRLMQERFPMTPMLTG